MDGYGQYINTLTGSPGDDGYADDLEKGTQQREISKHMRRKLIFDDEKQDDSGENKKKKKKKSFCNEVTGVGCNIQGGRRSRKKRRKIKKRSRKTRRRRGSGFCLTKECRRKRKEEKRRKRETKKFNKIREDADELLYSLAYDVCPLTTKAEYDECVDNIVNRNRDHYMEADEMLRDLKSSGKMRSASEPSVSSGPIAPPPGMKRKNKRNSEPIVGDGNLVINPLHRQGGRKRRRTRRKSKRRLRRRQRKSKKRRKRY